MFAVISRKSTPKQTFGCFYVFDRERAVFDCCTLELPWLNNQRNISCISTGEYPVEKIYSEKFGNCFLLKNVPGRSAILIHIGNYATDRKERGLVKAMTRAKERRVDTEGCILVGMRWEDINGDGNLDVIESGVAMALLLDILPNSFKLIIR